MMFKIKKSTEELTEHLREQLSALRSSMKGYDSGDRFEAKRLAAAIHMMCFDGKRNTKSIVSMLGMRKTMLFTSSFVFPALPPLPEGREQVGEAIFLPGSPLVSIYTCRDGTLEYRPSGEAGFHIHPQNMPAMQLDSWWDEVIFQKTCGIKLSRKNIILNVRDKDGGAHVDDHINDYNYNVLKKVGDWRVNYIKQTGMGFEKIPAGDMIRPLVRQMAWEIDYSFTNAGW